MKYIDMYEIATFLIGLLIGMLIGVILAGNAIGAFNKFCPECGHRYTSEKEYCSYDGSELKEKKND